MDSSAASSNSISNKLSQLYRSAIPSGIQALALGITPLVSPSVLITNPNANGTTQKSITKRVFTSFLSSSKEYKYRIGPSNVTVLTFSLSQLLSSMMILDNDIENGTGFATAWSTLYLIVSGRGSMHALLRYGRIWPLTLTGLAGSNAFFYGKEYLRGGFH
ncbi:hypothetical protein TBLA_0B07190 [Henningerozyma blattae CBS 6284]|uniref:Altered inheritance of mitochondria protein 19, mitochondrial n=1 Tax=Henningerozyma blattae (strain ATCC 34711 / CBS 6284 / DSM 70876 / NBRC 10599 / NRRL Y-10934 / UCD 77-7) TaxID=1071380 RepID=I2GZI4_HENB6|nr:hypothetical protein TBLA_0B07190 [Tetrapisispora blattae CBS 6284]CCH59536.1 hypothetical protein TBLA_0B07190 [Tetrapisispora blattae CBS 6284]